MKRILVVVRASTVAQETESQRKEMEDFCLSLGYAADEIEYLITAGASARKANAKYLKMIEDIKRILSETEIRCLAAWHINRLGRLESYLMQLKEWLITHGIQLYIKNPSLKLLNDDGTVNNGTEIAFSVFSTLVKHDTEEMMQKFQRGKQRNREQGKRADGGVPWAMYVDEEGYFRVDENKAHHIQHIYDAYLQGESTSYLRQYLDENAGFSTSTNHIYRLLKNRRYVMIVGQETWDKVQSLLTSKQSRPTSMHSYSFGQQIIRCACCGRHYYKTGEVYSCVGNSTRAASGVAPCANYCHFNRNRMDCILMFCTMLWMMKYYKEESGKRELERKSQINDCDEKMMVLTTKIKACEDKIQRITEMYIDGNISKDVHARKTQETRSDVVSLSEEMKRLQQRRNALESLQIEQYKNVGEHYKDMINELNDETKKELYETVHKMVSEALLTVDGKYRIIRVQSKIYDDHRTFVTYGSGRAFRLFYCKRLEIKSGAEFATVRDKCKDVTNESNFKMKFN